MTIKELRISICVGIKNRTLSLIDNLITSLNDCNNKEQLELSIYDCGSTDIDSLYEIVRTYWKGRLVYYKEDRPFERSYSFNRAVEQSSYDYIFLCDADITIPVDFINQYYYNVYPDKCWFPICFSLARDKDRIISEENGWWRETGYGMVGLSKKNFLEVKGLNEDYKKWGGEDNDFYNRIPFIKVRNKCIGLFHNWHPSIYNLITTPAKFKHLEQYPKRIVTGITTYNRLNYLKDCIMSWYNTINKEYEWILIIADDGSTDDIIEYIKNLKLHNIQKVIFLNKRKGVHYQTNNILQYCSGIRFDYGFKIDDDIIFLKKGWDDLYISAIEKTGYSHLCFFDIERGLSHKQIGNPVFKDDILCSYVVDKGVHGAFWTFTPLVIKRIGYFDIENFGFCGYGHVDYTFRCARAGFNDINNIYDCIDSNKYIKLRKENYKPALPDKVRYIFNTEKEIKRKKKIIEDNSRIYIELTHKIKNEFKINFFDNHIDTINLNKLDSSKIFNFLFYNNYSPNLNHLFKYVTLLKNNNFEVHIHFIYTFLDKKMYLSNSKEDIGRALKNSIIIIDSYNILNYIDNITGSTFIYFITNNELQTFKTRNVLKSILTFIKKFNSSDKRKYTIVTDSEEVRNVLIREYKINVNILKNKKDIISFFNLIP